MAAKVLTFVLILTYYRTVPGQSTCMEDQFACVGDSTCKPRSYLCDGVKDCVDGSDEINCVPGDCHCRERLECRMNNWCAIFGCDPGWTGYKCAFPTKDISSTLHVPTTTIQSLPDTSCHCEIQSLCADRIQSTTCNCQEGWSGYRCSEMLTFALDDSWKMIGVGLVVIIVFSVVSLALAFLHRLKRRGYSRSHQRLIESQESLGSSSIPPQLCSAPPSYEDVIGQEAQRHSSHNLILTANDNSVEEPPPPSYDSVIKHQQELLQGNQTQGEPVQQDTINHGTIELQNEGLAQTQTESTNAQNRTETSDVQHDS